MSKKTVRQLCPICRNEVNKTKRYGQVSYDCGVHWGPWGERRREGVKRFPLPNNPFYAAN